MCAPNVMCLLHVYCLFARRSFALHLSHIFSVFATISTVKFSCTSVFNDFLGEINDVVSSFI